jgi:hypothetical protein
MIKLRAFRGKDRVLGPQSGVVHADGRPRGRHDTHQAVRHLRRSGDPARDRGAHDVHDRLHLRRAFRPQPGYRLAETRIFSAGPVAGRRVFGRRYQYVSEYIQVMWKLWETDRSDFQGEFFKMDDCRLSPRPQPIKAATPATSPIKHVSAHWLPASRGIADQHTSDHKAETNSIS